jgi:[protein-PII] uridylyltransferase
MFKVMHWSFGVKTLKRICRAAQESAGATSRAGELAYLLEPDLKEARGGLRDIQALRAIALSGAVTVPLEKISWAESTLNNVRETLTYRQRS